MPDAPVRLSTTICWPSGLARSLATRRAIRSTLPPGGNGAMMRTGLAGYSAAKAWAAMNARKKSAMRRFMYWSSGARKGWRLRFPLRSKPEIAYGLEILYDRACCKPGGHGHGTDQTYRDSDPG